MKITIISIGKYKNSPEMEIFTSYLKRTPWKIELKELEVKKNASGEVLKNLEGELILNSIPENSVIITLDENGKNITSTALAENIRNWQISGKSHFTFIIGGAFGLSDKVKSSSDISLAFGKLTWPHLLIRAMISEQIYRVYTILEGHPYHKA